MDDELHIGPGIAIPLDLVQIRASRSSGPGGQHANVTASRIEASIDLDTLADVLNAAQRNRLEARFGTRASAVAQDTRSQLRNRELALERLEAKLRVALTPPPPRRPSRPTRASVERRLQSKRRQSARKHDRRPPSDT
ncbi:peptide chain release factor-like protein [Conexibacter sp. DBS9H8]|uniref:peptide chain release factor-like protein n=1 Tax=Conexibacter sp. DBS9H8 TaxID=2937801 RepID=UPI00200E5C52|nr:peptide chain release factor-like protein [Conexibacter sp. DBS9H8]